VNPNILGFFLALILGVALGFAFSIGLYDAIQPLREWQSLVAGLFATIVGLFTAALIWSQLYVQKQQIEERRRSEALGATARLPDALSKLSSFTKQCVRYLTNKHDRVMAAPPTPPSEAIQAIQESVRYVDPLSAKQLYELIVHYQILNSRLPDFGPDGSWLEGQDFYDVALLQSHVNRAFPFARNSSDEIPGGSFTRDEVRNGLQNSVGSDVIIEDDPKFRDFFKRINREHDND